MRKLLVAALALSASACVCAKQCESDTDCPGGYCNPSIGACVLGDAGSGGSGGGAMGGGGGGGGATGGGGGAGGAGGGSGGGAGGGTSPALAALVFVSPVMGAALDASILDVRVQALPMTADAGTVSYALSLTDGGSARSGTLQPVGGNVFSTMVNALGDGEWRATAFSGGIDASVNFEVDATAPQVSLFVEAPPARQPWQVDSQLPAAWKKDESALVQAEASEPVVIAAQDFTTMGVSSATGCVRPCGAGKTCACFAVDLGVQSLSAPRGTVQVNLGPVRDRVGHASSPAMAPVPVTRWKWGRDLYNAGGVTVSAPAISANGRVVVAARVAATGVVNALDSDGTLLWAALDGGAGVTAGPVVGAQNVYVATSNGSDSSIRRIDLNTGVPAVGQLCGNLGGGLQFEGDLVLGGSGAGETIFGARDGNLCAGTGAFPPQPVTVSGTPSLVVTSNGTTHDVFVGSTGSASVSKHSFNITLWTSMGSSNVSMLFPQGLFLFGTTLGGGGGGPTTGGAFVTSAMGVLSGTASQYAPANTFPGGAAIVTGTNSTPFALFGDSGGGLTRVAINGTMLASTATESFDAGTPLQLRSPVLGQGGKVYTVGADRALRVLSGTPLTEEWNWPGGAGGILGATTVSELALDAHRESGTKVCSRPGVLYVAAANAGVARLYAFIVDSKGLDMNAPWPKRQHDNANTGNPGTDNSAWSCQ